MAMSDFRSPFPRQDSGTVQTPDGANAHADSKNRIATDLDNLAGDSRLVNPPTLRGMEANTADGRVSRYATSDFEDTSRGTIGQSVEGDVGCCTGEVAPYGDAGGPTVHTQGGMPRDLPGGPSLTFDD